MLHNCFCFVTGCIVLGFRSVFVTARDEKIQLCCLVITAGERCFCCVGSDGAALNKRFLQSDTERESRGVSNPAPLWLMASIIWCFPWGGEQDPGGLQGIDTQWRRTLNSGEVILIDSGVTSLYCSCCCVLHTCVWPHLLQVWLEQRYSELTVKVWVWGRWNCQRLHGAGLIPSFEFSKSLFFWSLALPVYYCFRTWLSAEDTPHTGYDTIRVCIGFSTSLTPHVQGGIIVPIWYKCCESNTLCDPTVCALIKFLKVSLPVAPVWGEHAFEWY